MTLLKSPGITPYILPPELRYEYRSDPRGGRKHGIYIAESEERYTYTVDADLQKTRRDMPALPFCQVTLKASKPTSPAYPHKTQTLGDHLRKKRLDLGLLQKEVAQKIGVDEITIYNWEKNRTSPNLYSISKIIEFLGYTPQSLIPKTLGESLIFSRLILGLTQKELAHRLGVDPSTLARWEAGRGKPMKKFLYVIDDFLTSLPFAAGKREE